MRFGLARGRQLDPGEYGITRDDLPPFEQGPVDPRAWFGEVGRRAPLHIEIGSGKGTFLVQQAPRAPEINYLGIEWAGEFFRYAADRVRRHRLANVRMLHDDAVEFIRFRLPDAVCACLHIYFPDPWPKKRHHKRRSIQTRNLEAFHRILEPKGEVRIVTDHDGYWEWIEQTVAECGRLFDREAFNGAEGADGDEIVGTNFERKYRREGRPFHAMRLRKTN